MRDRIWTELTQAKHNDEFNGLYSDRQRTWLRYFNIGVLIFSAGGVMGWTVWDGLPLAACVIIAAVSLLRLIQPHIIMTDKQISNLDTIQKFYADYYNKLERLWFDFEADRINDQQAADLFFDIRATENEIMQLVNDTIRTKPKSLVAKAKINSDEFFKRVFNTQIQ